ncbi:hypothetical protein LSP04_24120 [Levilactobacillus spicheri]|uniref:Uncharacterized protein n=1 Tax=Levilactobacillus spicheri TaxID=216463 RepID=A0ABQ0WS84_9LACO|nr:hypothetical protein LSP04_24120 [Levilactobacillus spicheri]
MVEGGRNWPGHRGGRIPGGRGRQSLIALLGHALRPVNGQALEHDICAERPGLFHVKQSRVTFTKKYGKLRLNTFNGGLADENVP